MWIRITRGMIVALLLTVAAALVQPAWAQLPTPSQPILLVQDSTSADPYQNFVSQVLLTEGLNGFQTAQLDQLTSTFLSNYDVVILPHLALTSAQAAMFQSYVGAGGTLVGFRPDLQLANVFGVASLGTTLSEGWLQINTGTAYGSALVNNVLRFHGAADLYSLDGATSLATLYSNSTTATTSPAAAINSYGSGQAILFSYDLTQTIVLMRQGNPAWAGYPNNHDGYNTMRPSQMFMDQGSGQYWNDLGNGALNDIPQADIQMRLFSNAVTISNTSKRPLPRLWYFPNQNRSALLFTGDDNSYPVSEALSEMSEVASYGGLFSYNMWNPFDTVSNSQVNTWLSSGYTLGVHFNDAAEVDSSGVSGSNVTWAGMQGVMSAALTSFASTYPLAPYPNTTRNRFLIWVSNDADGTPDQVANAKLFQNNGIQLDASFSAYPNRWGYMTGSGLPMMFLDTASGNVIPVYEQATQYEDDIELLSGPDAFSWNLTTASSHYLQSLSDSMNKYNTVITMLWHPEYWATYHTYADTALQFAQTNNIMMTTTGAWLSFWQARAATALSMPSFSANTLSFAATGAPAGLTLLVPDTSGSGNVVSSFVVDGVSQSFSVSQYQGVTYASVILAAGNHNVSVSYSASGRILGQVSPVAAVSRTSIQVQSSSITVSVPLASDGTYVAGPFPAGSYTVTPVSSSYTFSPTSQSVTMAGSDITNVNFNSLSSFGGETLFTAQTPSVLNQNDGPTANYELGTVFTSDVTGEITGIRFWKAPSESGTHVGNIWTSTGTLLASVTFTNETASGWQQQQLTAALAIAANTQYVVSVNTANAYYAATPGGLSSRITNQDLSSIVGNNGAFSTTPGQFPTNSFGGANYFRDVFFVPNPSGTLASLSVSPSSVTGGSTSTGTVYLTGPAPLGGAAVSISATNPLAQPHTIQSITFPGALQSNGSTSWATLGQTSVNPSTVIPISGIAGLTATVSGAGGLSSQILTECPADNCGWSGNFPAGSSILWTSGQYTDAETWAGNGPLTLTFSSPQRGLGFPIMADETGAFTATICAYDSSNNPLGCATFNENASATQANFIGVYDDTQEIASVTIDAGGALYPHDFAIGDISVVNAEESLVTVPSSVTVPAGSIGATFSIATNEVNSSTPVNITATYNATSNASLTLTPPVLSSITMNPVGVAGGSSSIGTVTLNTPAPSGGATVVLTSNVPAVQPNTIQSVSTASALPADGSVSWLNEGPSYTSFASPSVVPVNGVSNLNVTVSNSDNNSMYILSECPAANCGWLGNFAAGAGVLWVNGYYQNNGSWIGNGPMSLVFSSPIRGMGFQMMADESGAFTATVCAYNSSNTRLGCQSFNGTQSQQSQPLFVGIYDDAQQITSVTVDGGGALYPHDFAIGDLTVAVSQRVVAATVPSSVTVPAGDTSANFTVTTNPVSASTLVGITAAYDGTSTSATLTVTAPGISEVSLSPASVSGGSASSGTVTLNAPAPAGGITVALSSNNGAATVQSSVTVLAGSTSATFPVNTTAVSSATPVTMTASYSGVQKTATLTVVPASTIATIAMDQASVLGGNPSTGTITLNGPAPTGGALVSLSSSDPSTTVPATITVPAGSNSVTFTAATVEVGVQTVVTITGTYNGAERAVNLIVNPPLTGGGPQSAGSTVNSPTLSSVSLNPTTVTHDASVTGTVTISEPAPTGGFVVNLSSSNTSVATVPATVTVAAGATTAQFAISTFEAAPSPGSITISASQTGSTTRNAALTVN